MLLPGPDAVRGAKRSRYSLERVLYSREGRHGEMGYAARTSGIAGQPAAEREAPQMQRAYAGP